MATLISMATGNFTAAGTWNLADATSELDSEASSTATTTSYVASANFTPGAITVDAIAVKVASRTSGATGTFSLELYNSTGGASVQTAVIDAVDMPLAGGWVVLTITSTLLLAATNYQVRLKSSVAGTVTLYRNATAGNWSRQLRTTTTQAPAAGDKLIIAGEHTGAGTGNNFTVTMDETATTIYGNASFLQSITVNKRSTLTYGTTAATNYLLKVAGIVKVNTDGTFNIGTVGTPIPATSTAKLEFSVTTNVDSGLEIHTGGTFTSQGTTLHTVERAMLNADLAAAGTVLTTDVPTGWLAGEQIAFASTTRTTTENETRVLSINAAGTAVTVTSGATYAHSGTGSTKAEVINLVRNVKIFGTSTTLCAYVQLKDTSVSDIDYTEFYYLGSATANKHGVEVQTTTGSAALSNCSFHDYFATASTAAGIYSTISTLSNVTIEDNNFWYTNYIGIYFTASNTSFTEVITISDNWFINGQTGSTFGILILPTAATVSNNRIAGYNVGMQINSTTGGKLGAHSGNVIHSCASGLTLSNAFEGTISNLTVWRTGGLGITMGNCSRVEIDGVTSFGHTSGTLTLTDNKECLIKNMVSNSDTSYTQPYGIYLTGPNPGTIIYAASLGATTSHTTADLVTTAVVNDIIFHDTIFASSTELSISTWKLGGEYFSQNHQGTPGNNKRVAWEGTSTIDTTIYNTASPSLRMAPATAVVKLRTPRMSGSVLSGATLSVSAYIRKSVIGDGTAYNGNQPRLVVKANPAAGILTDTVLDTASGAAGSWELLSGVTAAVTQDTKLDFYIDCDGTTGWVNVDDVSLLNEALGGLPVWADGVPFVTGSANSAAYYTDPGETNVRLGVTYKFNSLTLNKTGTVRVPTTAQVKTGVIYDDADSLTGTYDGSDRWTDPGDDNVRLATAYKANSTTNNKTGRVTVPTAIVVLSGFAFETDAATTGTLSSPTAAQVADAVWDEAISGHVTAGTFGEEVAKEDTLVKVKNLTAAGL